MIIGAHGWGGTPRRFQLTGWGRPKKMLWTVDRPLLLVVTMAYHLHKFFSLANLNIQKSLKHSNTRRVKAELSTRAPCSVCTHRRPNRALLRVILHLNEQIQIAVKTCKQKKLNSAPVHSVLCAQGTPRENVWYYLNNPTRLKAHQHRICLFLLL